VIQTKYLIGIDEAGRGPLAGPVSVGAVCLPQDFNTELLVGVRDSKKLSPQARDDWFTKLTHWEQEGLLHFHVALVSAQIIDTKGITHAIKQGLEECLDILDIHHDDCMILLDGSLHAPERFKLQQTIIKGDDIEPIISLASIAAKVTRDRYIIKIAEKYPQYGFEIHKGYGTKAHRDKIKKFGPCKIHRKSFLKVFSKTE
jgi:ribonuclease HII